MQFTEERPVGGQVFRVVRKAGPVWCAKYRLPDGRQVQKKLGPVWTGRGRPADGFFTKRSAEAWLREVLAQARAGRFRGWCGRACLFEEAAAEWLRYAAEDRACKPSTMGDYRTCVEHHPLPAFGRRLLEDIVPHDIERWRASLACSARTKNKLLTVWNGILRRAQKA